MSFSPEILARVDILELADDRSQFVVKSSCFMLGESASLANSASDISSKNRKLVSKIGANIVNELALAADATNSSPAGSMRSRSIPRRNSKASASKTKTGGDDDAWDEMDDADFENLLNADDTPISTESRSAKMKSDSSHEISDLSISTNDTIVDIVEKVAVVTNVPPYAQYIWCAQAARALTSSVEISMPSLWHSTNQFIEGIPVEYINADARPPDQLTAVDFIRTSPVMVIQCIDLTRLIAPKRQTLEFLARADSVSYGIIHENFVSKFYPGISIPMLTQLLVNPDGFSDSFPELSFDRKASKRKLAFRAELIKTLFGKKSSSDRSAIGTSTSRDVSISTINIGVIGKYPGEVVKRVDTEAVFNLLNVNEFTEVGSVDLYRTDINHRDQRLRKISERAQQLTTVDRAASIHPRVLASSKSIVLTFLPTQMFKSLEVILDVACKVSVSLRATTNRQYSQDTLLHLIAPAVNATLSKINAFDRAFYVQQKYPLIETKKSPVVPYVIQSSSSRLMFTFLVSYSKILNLFAETLLNSGIVSPNIESSNSKNYMHSATFILRYGISATGSASSIHVTNSNNVASITMFNLSAETVDFHISLITKLILNNRDKVKLDDLKDGKLSAIDPVLYQDRTNVKGYSRICQKKFQPLVVSADDKNAVKYHNFTFDRPEYYKCPTKHAPYLGFIKNKHNLGYCLPCCRKTKAIETKPASGATRASSEDDDQLYKTYKIEYPPITTPNDKLIDRRCALPTYVCQILGRDRLVANGNSASKLFRKVNNDAFQTATLIAASEKGSATNAENVLEMHTRFKSFRELVLAIIEMLKRQSSQSWFMREKLVASQFTSAFALANALEDKFIRSVIVSNYRDVLSTADWNDLIVTLTNAIGCNTLLLADRRLQDRGLEMTNLHQVDVSKPVFIILKRVDLERSIYMQDAAAIYLPVTSNGFKIRKLTNTVLPRFDASKHLRKLVNLSLKPQMTIFDKQFSERQCRAFVDSTRRYQIAESLPDQKMVAIGVNKKILVTSVASMSITPSDANVVSMQPTASVHDLVAFIEDYNAYILDASDVSDTTLKQYQLYMKLAVKSVEFGQAYEYPSLGAYPLKISEFVMVDDKIIGANVNVVDMRKILASEVVFCAGADVKTVNALFEKSVACIQLAHKQLKLRQIITNAFSVNLLVGVPRVRSVKITKWLNNPLKLRSNKIAEASCSKSLIEQYNIGMYNSMIYPQFTKTIIDWWAGFVPSDLIKLVTLEISKASKWPIGQATIEALYQSIDSKLPNYDPAIIRVTLDDLFVEINKKYKSTADATAELKTFSGFNKFALRNVHRLKRDEIMRHVKDIVKETTVSVNNYPDHRDDVDSYLYTEKNKLIVHKSMESVLIETLVADLCNPFRRDYIINTTNLGQAVRQMIPHAGETIYVSNMSKF